MKRIGFLFGSASFNEMETYKMLPSDVSLHITRIPMNNVSYEVVLHMADAIEEAAKLLTHVPGLGVIAFNCTAGSFIKGKGYDQEIIERIVRATGVPATTMVTAVVMGLRALGIHKLVMLTPYTERMTKLEKVFLEEEGFEVLAYKCLGLDNIIKQNEVEPMAWYQMTKEMQDPRADGYFLSCGGIRVVDVIERLETELEKPVVTSNQATLWHCLRKVGYQRPVEGFGRLMRTTL